MADEHKEYDVIVVGAGIAGPAVAVGFAKQGRSVLVIERDLSEPDRIVGELLQPGGIKALEKLGMQQCINDIDAIKCKGYEVIYKGNGVNIPYPLIDGTTKNSGKTGDDQDEGPRELGCGFHHGRFIMNLRKAARETPGVTMVEGTVTQTIRNPYTNHVLGVKVSDKALGELHYHAKLTVMCDGIQSKFRKQFSDKVPYVKSHFAGLVLHNAVLPSPNFGHVIIGTEHQPILVYQIGANETRILCDIAGHLPSNGNGDLKRHLFTKVLPHLPKCLQPSFEEALETQRIRTMPAQFLPGAKSKDTGCILMGDALNMRHPLTGGGMTVAFNDALLLTDLLSPEKVEDLANRQVVAKQMNTFYYRRKDLDVVVNVLSMALYQLFAASGENLRILQRGCFGYFRLGGVCIDEPVALLAALLPRPIVLFYHFFSVAFYGIWLNFLDRGILGFPLALIQVFTVLWTAIAVFGEFIWEELKWW